MSSFTLTEWRQAQRGRAAWERSLPPDPVARATVAIRDFLEGAGRDASEAEHIARGLYRAHQHHAYRQAGCMFCPSETTADPGYRTTSRGDRVDPLP